MYWLIAGLFVLGAACGATVRLLFFIAILLGAAAIVVISTLAQGGSGTLLNAVVAVITLQVGYAAGIALRAAVRSRLGRRHEAATTGDGVGMTIGEKRQ
jgi:hypothetical protein